MRRLTGIALVVWSASAAAAPSGRVVRVERAGGPSTRPPMLCQVRGDGGNCVGDEPHAGQIVTVLDDHHVVAEIQVVEAKVTLPGCENLWTIKTRVVRGVVTDGDRIGVIDAGVNPSRAHLVDKANLASPSGPPGDEVWHAIDRDGDGTADIVSTRYSCDAAGRPVIGATTFCLDIWSRGAGRLAHGASKLNRTTQLNFATCNI